MVDRASLSKVNDLYHEYGQITQAIHNFDNGGHIVSVVVGGPAGEMPAELPAEYMAYPPQMVAAIKTALEDRRRTITTELSGLGLRGLETASQSARTTPRPATSAREAPAPPKRR